MNLVVCRAKGVLHLGGFHRGNFVLGTRLGKPAKHFFIKVVVYTIYE